MPTDDLPQTRIVKNGDRDIAYAEYGKPDGRPLFQFHGQPGSRFQRFFDEGAYVRHGLRVVMIDRPGYGATTRREGRTIADVADDVVVVADALGISRFAVLGPSMGAAHALAVAAVHPERVAACAALVPPAPRSAPIDHEAGLGDAQRKEHEAAAKGPDHFAEFLRPMMDHMLGALARGELPFPAPPPAAPIVRQWVPAAWAQGTDGYVDDHMALMKPWGFDFGAVRAPTLVVVASADDCCPPQLGRWVAGQLPNATLVTIEGGHLAFLPSFPLVLSKLDEIWPQ